MNIVLIKALGVMLTFSQVFTQPETLKVNFNPERDQAEVLKILRAGCHAVLVKPTPVTLMKKPALSIAEVEALLANMEANSKGVNPKDAPTLRGLRAQELRLTFEVFCKNKELTDPQIDLAEVIRFYNRVMSALPDVKALKGEKFPQSSRVFNEQGVPFTDLFTPNNRRSWVPIGEIPERLQMAYVTAEDGRFFKHHGVDLDGLIKAALFNARSSGREHGGSTITQQLVKNVLVGNERSEERKMREAVLSVQLEQHLSKEEILELYLNYIYLGRSSWGVGMAAEAYFAKPLQDLSTVQIAFLGALPKGPNLFNPDRNLKRTVERTRYVLDQMSGAGVIGPKEYRKAVTELEQGAMNAADGKAFLAIKSFSSPRPRYGRYAADYIAGTLKAEWKTDPHVEPLTIRSTLHHDLQLKSELLMQEGLFRYEMNAKRAKFKGPEDNLSEEIESLNEDNLPKWLRALRSSSLTVADVHWSLAIVLPQEKGRKSRTVGFEDGEVLPLKSLGQKFNDYDVIYTSRSKDGAELRIRPEIQGAALIVENRTGKILSMVGGFSHSDSPYNRAAQMQRHPGSTVKVLTYLAALNTGLQPNTLLVDGPVKIGAEGWEPDNYDERKGSSRITLRRGFELSRNRVAARLLFEIEPDRPRLSLRYILALMKECGLHENPPVHWSAILGSLDVPLTGLATCFATIANEGHRPNLHMVDAVELDGRSLLPPSQARAAGPMLADEISYFQLRTLLQGVVRGGTAKRLSENLKDLIPKGKDLPRRVSDYVAGKTGTSQNSRDVWFAGFTRDVTIVVWLGYDNATADTARTLGESTAASVAVPLFEDLLRETVKSYPLTPLPPPSEAVTARTQLQGTKLKDGQPVSRKNSELTEYLRVDRYGRAIDTWKSVIDNQRNLDWDSEQESAK